jgi:hypothetical protein
MTTDEFTCVHCGSDLAAGVDVLREADARSLLADFWGYLVESGVAEDRLDINYRGALLVDYQRRITAAHFPNPSEDEFDCAEDGEAWPCAIARAALAVPNAAESVR